MDVILPDLRADNRIAHPSRGALEQGTSADAGISDQHLGPWALRDQRPDHAIVFKPNPNQVGEKDLHKGLAAAALEQRLVLRMRSTTERTYACAVTPLLAERYWQLYLAYSWKGHGFFAFQAPGSWPIGRLAPSSSVHAHGTQCIAIDGSSSSGCFRAVRTLRP